MPTFTAQYRCTYLRTACDFTADTPEQALELARAKYRENHDELVFEPIYDTRHPPLQQITIHEADFDEPTDVRWQSNDCRLREAAAELLEALETAIYALDETLDGFGPSRQKALQNARAAVVRARPADR